MSTFRETPEFRKGQFGESVVSAWLRSRGYWVIELARIETGGAPALIGELQSIPLLDLLTFRDTRPGLFEVKTAEQALMFRMIGKRQHGMTERSFAAYLAMQHTTGIACHVAFVQLDEQRLYVQSLENMRRLAIPGLPGHEWRYNGRKQLFWNVEHLIEVPDWGQAINLPARIAAWRERQEGIA